MAAGGTLLDKEPCDNPDTIITPEGSGFIEIRQLQNLQLIIDEVCERVMIETDNYFELWSRSFYTKDISIFPFLALTSTCFEGVGAIWAVRGIIENNNKMTAAAIPFIVIPICMYLRGKNLNEE